MLFLSTADQLQAYSNNYYNNYHAYSNNYYNDHHLTIARHPSENDERMMLRLVAFIANANEHLQFTRGLSEDHEPDLWQKSFSDDIELWIELGQPSEQRIKKGCNQSQHMMLYSYADNSFNEWWKKEQNKLRTRDNLSVFTLPEALAETLSNNVSRSMQIQVTIQDGQMWLNITGDNHNDSLEVVIEKLQ